MAEGGFSLQSEPGKGTRVEADLPAQPHRPDAARRSGIHLPGGAGLLSTNSLDFVPSNKKMAKADEFVFDDAELKAELGDLSMTEPEVLTFCARHARRRHQANLRCKLKRMVQNRF
jgi:hypothetical protein